MERHEIDELHYITPLDNISSILSNGILCYERSQKIKSVSVAMGVIQEKRERKVVPNGLPLHKYANLYFHARNPMLYRLQSQHGNLCVLRIDIEVLDLPNVVISDMNASSDYVAFFPSPEGLAYIDRELVFAEYWTDDIPFVYYRKKSIKCAEVLVPEKIPPNFIFGMYVSCEESYKKALGMNLHFSVSINSHLFFQ
jgi:hypothetical protein